MIIYSVTIAIQAEIETEWVTYMKDVHVPDVLRTGCFSECQTYKVLDAGGNEPTYVLQYQCGTLQDYHRYRDAFAPALQKEHLERFAGKFRGSRQVLDEVSLATPSM